MGSNSGRRSGSSGRSTPRKRVVIGADETVRVRYRHDKPEVESERRPKRARTSETSAQRSSAGKRLSKNKRQEREHRRRVLRVRRISVAVAVAAAVVGLIWGAYAIYRAPILPVKQIVVEGNRHFETAAVLEMARVPKDATMLRLDVGSIAKRLKSDPWIADARVERDFPASLRIVVTERRPAAIVDGGGEALWVVSTDRTWLGVRSAEDTGLALIRDVPSIEPTSGARVREAEVINAVRVVLGLSSALRSQVKLVSAPTVEETKILTQKNVEIFIGQATQMEEKDRIVRAILREQKGKVVYINVRVLDRPTWRGLEPEGQ